MVCLQGIYFFAAALLLQSRPNTPSQVVGSILQNSGVPKLWGGNPGLGLLDNVHRQGAGMVDIDDAISSLDLWGWTNP